jgi:hypothetical protein
MDSSLQTRSFSLSYFQRALNVISEHDLRAPDEVGLRLIIAAALEAQALLFNAALVKPEFQRLNELFDAFVLECAR